MRRVWIALLALGLVSCASRQPQRPYIVLISLDGFRYDYLDIHSAPNLRRIADEGVRAQAMIPAYRTNTFPNHYAIATGLYPEHNGIVDNNFYDPERKQAYAYNQKATGGDGSWYGGTPLWVLAEQQGVRSAAFFWPATDAEIQGTRPWKYFPYDESVPAAKRVDQVLEWLRLPEAERPHFITMYFHHTDSAGHEFGPESPENARAVAEVDAEIGRLYDGIRAIDAPVNLFIVSDHGMMKVEENVSIGQAADFEGFEISPAGGSQVMLYSSDSAAVERTYAKLKQRNDPRFAVYRRETVPAHLHYNDNPRIGDIVIMPTAPVSLYIEKPGQTPRPPSPGAHGYDPERFPQIGALFIAQGPNIQQGLTIYPFDNVNIYPLIAGILRLDPPQGLDGSLFVLSGILRDQPEQ